MAESTLLRPSLLGPSLYRTLFFVSIAAAALILIDSVLANTERQETTLEAARFNRDGQRLLQEGRYADSAEAFRSAIANARENKEYPLALGEALLDAGKLEEAEATLTELLKADSLAGAPNLAMARVFAKKRQFVEADSYYHRAIYGQWKEDARGNQVKTRFELAELLAQRNSKAELLAELLPLEEQAPSDTVTREKLAGLYLTAGSPTHAAAIFHDLARAEPQNPEAHEGVGEAEFALGNYTAAQSGFIATLRLRPNDQAARKRLELCDQILNLDPARRGLNGQERYERSVHVLQLVADRATECPASAQTAASVDLIGEARTALNRRVRAADQSDAVEANLELANRVWQAERARCAPSIPQADEPLELVLAKSLKASQ